MAVTYAVADGPNVADVSLNDLAPQPRSTGVQVTQRTYAADGSVHQQASYVELIWDMVQDATAYQAILAAFGLASALTNEVTVRVPGPTGNAVRMNGIAVQPEVGRDMQHREYFFRNVTVLVKELETAT